MWNRKRKIGEEQSNNDRKPYAKVVCSNPKMEAYYAVQGLHSLRREGDSHVPCSTSEEKEAERMRFMKSLRSTLPASFRIGQNIEPEFREKLIQDVENFVGTEIEIEIDEDGNPVGKVKVKVADADAEAGADASDINTEMKDTSTSASDTPEPEPAEVKTTIKKLAPAKSIPYIPNGYQLSVDKRTIRRNPALHEFHEWLKVQTEAGFITRQETVSMIPPVVLSPESHHAVLDMCAAPGSKTSQLLEIVSAIPDGEIEPKGFVVANDSDAKRAYMLVHQLRRLNSPAAFVTAKDAQFWPLVLRGENVTDEERAQEGMFDRVLCDVPCSGDGTARKNPGIWKHWSASAAHSLHPLQISICLNGARLTKVGGYVCYSTCSMNPIENEAVVAEILRASDGSLELVDKRPDLTGIIARPGWSNWKVMGESQSRKIQKNNQKKKNAKMMKRRKEWEEKEKLENEGKGDVTMEENNGKNTETEDKETKEDTEAETVEDVWEPIPPSWDEETLQKRAVSRGLIEYKTPEDVPFVSKGHIKNSCFPPTPEEAEKFKLERCLRCLPHDLDTGGFFVALLKKVSPMSARARKKADELANAVASKLDHTTSKKTVDGNAKVEETKTNADGAVSESKRDGATGEKEAEPKKNKRRYGFDNSESFIAADEDVFTPLIDFYGFTADLQQGQFMARQGGNAKILYFITKSVKKNLIDRGVQDRVQVINSGLRAFERRNKEDCVAHYRPCQEAIQYIAPHMTKRKFALSHDDFLNCLNDGRINITSFSEPVAAQFQALSLGAFVVALKGYENNIVKKMYLVMWRGKGESVDCLVTKGEKAGFHSKLKSIHPASQTEGDAP